MLITRLDAMHPAGDGVFCVLFLHGRGATALYADRLRSCGWCVDVYQEDVGQITTEQREFLLGGYWPLVPTSTLLEWYANPPAVGADGDDVVELKGGPSCKK